MAHRPHDRHDGTPAIPRLCYAAAHVIMKNDYRDVAHSFSSPGAPEEIAQYINWDATMAFRRHLDGCGFGIAEAMDTAQRFSLGWANAQRLIRDCGQLDLSMRFIAGAGVDHLDEVGGIDDLIEGVVFQARLIQESGGDVILLPMAWLTEHKADEHTYIHVYTSIIDALDGPIFLHWLGEMFSPSLAGYFPGDSFFRIMAHNPAKVRGAKISLLDETFECSVRSRLLADKQIVLTGDDFHFASLIAGEGTRSVENTMIGEQNVPLGEFSHALLGVLDAIAEPAARAMQSLASGDVDSFFAQMRPCETLGQSVFQAPTHFYKSGLAFLSWLNGHQDNFMLLNHEERMRPAEYYEEIYTLALKADALRNPSLAVELMESWRADH